MSAPAQWRDGVILVRTYGTIRVPCFHMTGTRDDSPLGETRAADRRIPYDHMFGGDNYLLTFAGGDHMVFSGRPRAAAGGEKDERYHALILAGSTAFWDAYLNGDTAAKAWLADGDFQAALGDAGTFEKKAAGTRRPQAAAPAAQGSREH